MAPAPPDRCERGQLSPIEFRRGARRERGAGARGHGHRLLRLHADRPDRLRCPGLQRATRRHGLHPGSRGGAKVHGPANERFQLESALVLTTNLDWDPDHPDAGEDGLLQAWEIFESLRIDADLVTLSACKTALGEEVAGEGIVGLTRAFQYAGARCVLASL